MLILLYRCTPRPDVGVARFGAGEWSERVGVAYITYRGTRDRESHSREPWTLYIHAINLVASFVLKTTCQHVGWSQDPVDVHWWWIWGALHTSHVESYPRIASLRICKITWPICERKHIIQFTAKHKHKQPEALSAEAMSVLSNQPYNNLERQNVWIQPMMTQFKSSIFWCSGQSISSFTHVEFSPAVNTSEFLCCFLRS